MSVDWPILRGFMAYKVRHAAKDESLGHAMVRHEKGRAQRI